MEGLHIHTYIYLYIPALIQMHTYIYIHKCECSMFRSLYRSNKRKHNFPMFCTNSLFDRKILFLHSNSNRGATNKNLKTCYCKFSSLLDVFCGHCFLGVLSFLFTYSLLFPSVWAPSTRRRLEWVSCQFRIDSVGRVTFTYVRLFALTQALATSNEAHLHSIKAKQYQEITRLS